MEHFLRRARRAGSAENPQASVLSTSVAQVEPRLLIHRANVRLTTSQVWI